MPLFHKQICLLEARNVSLIVFLHRESLQPCTLQQSLNTHCCLYSPCIYQSLILESFTKHLVPIRCRVQGLAHFIKSGQKVSNSSVLFISLQRTGVDCCWRTEEEVIASSEVFWKDEGHSHGRSYTERITVVAFSLCTDSVDHKVSNSLLTALLAMTERHKLLS